MDKIYFLQACKFPEQNVTYAENQSEYTPLPAHVNNAGVVTSCWKMPIWERIKFLFSGKLFISSLTFNKPLQPLRVSTLFFEE